ncbi:MAG TPA: DUF4178 domain-containing protein [Chitinophagales bacterium]|nr:DUF4178 domain-containing protein [Chitinophagales bacterium]
MHFGKGSYILCAECNTQLGIQSDYSQMRVCDSCGCVNYKHPKHGKVTVVKFAEDLSAIKTGSTGKIQGSGFTVTGRYRIETSGSYYNLWSVVVSKTDELAWLIESAGKFVFAYNKKVAYNAIPEPALWSGDCDKYYALPELGSCRLVTTDKIAGRNIEGETGDMPPQNEGATFYDLRGDDGQAIFIIKTPDKTLYYLQGTVVTWQSLELTNLKNMPATGNDVGIKPLTHKCTCGNLLQAYTQAQAKKYACGQCGSYYQIHNGAFSHLIKKEKPAEKPLIPLGTQGEIEDKSYTVVGFIVKKETRYKYNWAEYILFNPIYGYAYLSEYNGHWMFLKEVDFHVSIDTYTREVQYENNMYWLYSKYLGKVIVASGEFAYDVHGTGKPKLQDYIAPPQILVREYTAKEIKWLHGYYIEPEDIQRIFKTDALPKRTGIGVIQPQSFSVPFAKALAVAVLAGMAILMAQFAFYYTGGNNVVYNYTGRVSAAEMPAKAIVSPSFDLVQGTRNLEVALTADVANSWFETDITLINEKTDDDVDLEIGVEYYSGYEGGEHWSEGSNNATRVINAVPEGRYHLLITPVRETYGPDMNFELQLKRDVPAWGNLAFAWFLLAIIPFIQYYRERSYEKQRWFDSNYTPYEDDSDE